MRYSAEGQRFLPTHLDESQLSLTVALNERSEFDGGGTFFEAAGRALCPEVGRVLAFRGGAVRHGGEPITRGVRYVIAAFLFLEP